MIVLFCLVWQARSFGACPRRWLPFGPTHTSDDLGARASHLLSIVRIRKLLQFAIRNAHMSISPSRNMDMSLFWLRNTDMSRFWCRNTDMSTFAVFKSGHVHFLVRSFIFEQNALFSKMWTCPLLLLCKCGHVHFCFWGQACIPGWCQGNPCAMRRAWAPFWTQLPRPGKLPTHAPHPTTLSLPSQPHRRPPTQRSRSSP